MVWFHNKLISWSSIVNDNLFTTIKLSYLLHTCDTPLYLYLKVFLHRVHWNLFDLFTWIFGWLCLIWSLNSFLLWNNFLQRQQGAGPAFSECIFKMCSWIFLKVIFFITFGQYGQIISVTLGWFLWLFLKCFQDSYQQYDYNTIILHLWQS